MKSIVKQSNKKAAFTIIELLTVMSIIVILIGLLVPSMNMARRFARKLTQKNQLHVIGVAIEFFNSEWDGYPPSSALDGEGQPYCGALKLAEAMLGQDLMGFHPDSLFIRDGVDGTGRLLYGPGTLGARKQLYLQLESANVYRLKDLYGGNTEPLVPDNFVLCDVYTRELRTGIKAGMPILYYKAETTNNLHDPNNLPTPLDNNGNIYNHWDNQALLGLGRPWEEIGKATKHGLSEPYRFYKNTRNYKIVVPARPFRSDTFILMSAGYDGEYGTADDICNFDWRYRQ